MTITDGRGRERNFDPLLKSQKPGRFRDNRLTSGDRRDDLSCARRKRRRTPRHGGFRLVASTCPRNPERIGRNRPVSRVLCASTMLLFIAMSQKGTSARASSRQNQAPLRRVSSKPTGIYWTIERKPVARILCGRHPPVPSQISACGRWQTQALAQQ